MLVLLAELTCCLLLPLLRCARVTHTVACRNTQRNTTQQHEFPVKGHPSTPFVVATTVMMQRVAGGAAAAAAAGSNGARGGVRTVPVLLVAALADIGVTGGSREQGVRWGVCSARKGLRAGWWSSPHARGLTRRLCSRCCRHAHAGPGAQLGGHRGRQGRGRCPGRAAGCG
jgi:hypothetical protein